MSEPKHFKPNSIPQQLIMAAIHKMDLVTREEFEIQTKVLLRTREKLVQLEQRLLELQDGNI